MTEHSGLWTAGWKVFVGTCRNFTADANPRTVPPKNAQVGTATPGAVSARPSCHGLFPSASIRQSPRLPNGMTTAKIRESFSIVWCVTWRTRCCCGDTVPRNSCHSCPTTPLRPLRGGSAAKGCPVQRRNVLWEEITSRGCRQRYPGQYEPMVLKAFKFAEEHIGRGVIPDEDQPAYIEALIDHWTAAISGQRIALTDLEVEVVAYVMWSMRSRAGT